MHGIREQALPIPCGVKGAFSLLGLDPLYVANEGLLIALVGSAAAESVVYITGKRGWSRHAQIMGEVVEAPSGTVLLETAIGGSRVMDMLQGEQLPRIC